MGVFEKVSSDGVSMMSMGDMGSAPSHACKISMLWNWYTIDTCFIARSWHVRSKGGFAGSCIGVFFLVLAAQWLHRFCREYDQAIVARKQSEVGISHDSNTTSLSDKFEKPRIVGANSTHPMIHAISHRWMAPLKAEEGTVTASPLEHLVRSLLFTVEWGLSYVIMLLFMYYNGYIIISCILGALFGKFIFSYNEPLVCRGVDVAGIDSHDSDRKCCR